MRFTSKHGRLLNPTPLLKKKQSGEKKTTEKKNERPEARKKGCERKKGNGRTKEKNSVIRQSSKSAESGLQSQHLDS